MIFIVNSFRKNNLEITRLTKMSNENGVTVD